MAAFFHNLKTGVARAAVNGKISRYGRMTELKIDKHARTIHAVLELKGEPAPLHITLTGYLLSPDNNFSVESVQTSREWLTNLAEDYLKNRPFPLPEKAANALRMLL